MGLVALRHVGSSQTMDWTCISCIGRGILYFWATGEPISIYFIYLFGCTEPLVQHVGSSIFIMACGIFSWGMQTLSCGLWDLVPWPGVEPLLWKQAVLAIGPPGTSQTVILNYILIAGNVYIYTAGKRLKFKDSTKVLIYFSLKPRFLSFFPRIIYCCLFCIFLDFFLWISMHVSEQKTLEVCVCCINPGLSLKVNKFTYHYIIFLFNNISWKYLYIIMCGLAAFFQTTSFFLMSILGCFQFSPVNLGWNKYPCVWRGELP